MQYMHDTHTYMYHGLRETDKITQAGGDRNTCHVIAEDHVLAGAAPIGLWSGRRGCLLGYVRSVCDEGGAVCYGVASKLLCSA